jgi:hypothetical protein
MLTPKEDTRAIALNSGDPEPQKKPSATSEKGGQCKQPLVSVLIRRPVPVMIHRLMAVIQRILISVFDIRWNEATRELWVGDNDNL